MKGDAAAIRTTIQLEERALISLGEEKAQCLKVTYWFLRMKIEEEILDYLRSNKVNAGVVVKF